MSDSPLSLSTCKWWLIILLIENSGMQKFTFTSCAVQYKPAAVLYSTLLDRILRSYYLVCLIFIMLSIAPLSHKHVRPATVIAICFLPRQRLTVTNCRGYLALLDKLKLLLSKSGSFSMELLVCLSLFLFILPITT